MTVIGDSGYEPEGKSAAEIEKDITETRAELGAVLDAIERRLQPRRLLELGMYTLRDKMDENGGIIGYTLRNNPVPLALIGAGISWLLIASFERPAALARQMGDRIGEAARQVTDRTRDAAGGLLARAQQGDGAAAAYAQGEEMAGYAYARTKPRVAAAVETAGRARDRVARAIGDDPLTLGFIGLFTGLALALVLPESSAEERLIEPVRRRMRNRATEMGRDAVGRAQAAAEQAVDSVAEAIKP
ncbi:MAG: DUF3618 domain-containing protein, partial [Stellaceae bacterium]